MTVVHAELDTTLDVGSGEVQTDQPALKLTVEQMQRHIRQQAQAAGQPAEQPTVRAFPVDVFPAPLREVINQTAHYLQYRPDWIGASMLYAASVAIGNSLGTRYNNWPQKATLYMALVGMPGTNKSGPPEYALKPLRRVNAQLYKAYKEELADYNRWVELSKKERKEGGLPLAMAAPVYRTLLVSDVTPEALVQTHQANPLGLGLFMDELAGWFQNFNRYTQGSDQEFWLSIFSFAPISILRKTSVPIQIDAPFISILGTIQPGVLSELAKDRRSQNGFIDRILFAYPDDQHKPYDATGEPDERVLGNYGRCIDNLFSLRQGVCLDENGNPETKWLPFSPDAFEVMKAWRDENTNLVNQTDNPKLKGIYAKIDTYCIRLALLVEALDWACDLSDLSRIRPASVSRAIELAEYFRQNAQKVHYVLDEQTEAERLPKSQQRLFNALPGEVSTAEAVSIAGQLLPRVSERTVKRLLMDPKLFRHVRHGVYTKCG